MMKIDITCNDLFQTEKLIQFLYFSLKLSEDASIVYFIQIMRNTYFNDFPLIASPASNGQDFQVPSRLITGLYYDYFFNVPPCSNLLTRSTVRISLNHIHASTQCCQLSRLSAQSGRILAPLAEKNCI